MNTAVNSLDNLQLNFNPESMVSLNFIIALIMFGVALDLKKEDFVQIKRKPHAAFVGLLTQFVIFPLMSLLFVKLTNPHPALGLGIILLSCCPGGNLSNYLTKLGNGNVSLSIVMSAISTLVSFVVTPLNFHFYSSMHPPLREFLKTINIDPIELLINITLILLIPSMFGFIISYYFPKIKKKIYKPINQFSLLAFTSFIIVALVGNWENFLNHIGNAFFIVLICNGLGLFVGYYLARFFKLSVRDARACSFEAGIQNAGFCLILVFSFFNGLGGMALIAAWWGVWHLISGLALAFYWKKSDQMKKEESTIHQTQLN